MNKSIQKQIDRNITLLDDLYEQRNEDQRKGDTQGYNSTCAQIATMLETIAELAQAGECQ